MALYGRVGRSLVRRLRGGMVEVGAGLLEVRTWEGYVAPRRPAEGTAQTQRGAGVFAAVAGL